MRGATGSAVRRSIAGLLLAPLLALAACTTERASPPRDLALLDQGAIAPIRAIGRPVRDDIGRILGGVALPDGGLLLADADLTSLLEFDASGVLRRRTDLYGLANDLGIRPGPIVRLDDGTFWMLGGSTLVHFSARLDTLGTLRNGRLSASAGGWRPGGLASGRGNTFWVTDIAQSRVLHLAADGALLSTFGHYCADDCGFKYPAGLVEAADGSLLVVDRVMHRVRRYSPAGEYLGDVGTAADVAAPEGIAVSTTGGIVVFDGSTRQLLFYAGDGRGAPTRSGALDLPGYRTNLDAPLPIIPAPAGDVWFPGPTGLLRVSASGALVGSLGRARFSEPGLFYGVHAIERDDRRHFFVADLVGRIQELDARGVYLRDMPRDAPPDAESWDNRVLDMAVERTGTLYVLNVGLSNRLLRWEPGRVFPDTMELTVIAEQGMTADEVSCHPDGDLLVAASAGYRGERRLFRLDPTGALRRQWVLPRIQGAYRSVELTAFEVAPDGRIWAHGSFRDSPPYPFLALNDAGQLLDIWWLGITGIGTIAQPHGLQFDAQGNLLILSAESSVLFRYRPDGRLMNRWRLLADDGRALYFPLDAALTHDGRITLSSYGTSSVFEYDIGVE